MVVTCTNAMTKRMEKRKKKKIKKLGFGQPYIEKRKWCFKATNNFYIYGD